MGARWAGPSGSLGLAPFLDALELHLEALSADELRRVLLDHAEGLSAAERADFLAVFTRDHDGPERVDAELVDDVEAFIADVAGGAYAEGYGYDPEYRAHRVFGDETWTMDFEGLLDRAGRSLLAGDAANAREAYRRLLGALGEDYDEGGFPGAGTPDELIDDDLDEAKARYLRAVWESEPPRSRAAALVVAAEDVIYIGGDPSIAAIEAARRAPLPDLTATLSDLARQLGAVEGDRWGFGRQSQRWLAEVTERLRGVDGLADLARTPGEQQADAYRDWVDGLVRAGRLIDAEKAAHEALDTLSAYGPVQATIAERLGALTAVRDDRHGRLDALRAAWRADPSLERLLALVGVAAAVGSRDAVLAAEAERTGEGPLSGRAGLAAAVLLLAHRVEDAVAVLRDARPGWSPFDGHPGLVVVPFLLLGASGATSDRRFGGSLLSSLLDSASTVGWRYGAGADLEEFHALLAEAAGGAEPPPAAGDGLRLPTLLVDAIESHPAGPKERARWLDLGRDAVLARVDDVVRGQQRGAYEQAARLAVACAEAVAVTAGDAAGHELVDAVHARYPRHSAFRRELRKAHDASPLLWPAG